METVNNHHETRDASVPAILWVALGAAIAGATLCLAVVGIFRMLAAAYETAPARPMVQQQPEFPPEPRLREHPSVDLDELRMQEDQRLHHYGWIDRKAGVVHIPVERAIDLELERGFPARKGAQ